MSSLHDFDIHSRGCAAVVEDWKRNHERLKAVWSVEDLIKEMIPNYRLGVELFDRLRLQGNAGAEAFSYLLEILRRMVHTGRQANEIVSCLNDSRVEGADELQKLVQAIASIVDDDEFATRCAFASGALDDWD